nr:hypothetical protein [Tanacetum cinerariifolium]
VMSDASSAVTYTFVYTDSEPWRYYGEESAETRPPRVIVYGYDGLPMQPIAPSFPDYVPGPEHPPSPDYVYGPAHPPSPVEIPYVPEPEYPEYLAPSDDLAPLEDQPLPADASPIAASPDYVADSDLEEDPEDHQADYPVDGGDCDDEPFNDDDDDDDTESDPDEDPGEEPFEDEEDDEEEEEHIAPARKDTKALEADEPTPTPTPTPKSPHIIVLFSETYFCWARKTVKPEPSMSACIARHVALLSPPLLVPSLPLPFPSPLTNISIDTGAPLGYRAVENQIRALLPFTSRVTDTPEADMPPRKRACLTTLALRFKVDESSAAGAAGQPGPIDSDLKRYRVEQAGYERVTELDTTIRQRTDEFEIRFEGAQDDRALLRARVNTLFKDRPDHRRTTMLMDREAMYACEAWACSEDRSSAIVAHVRTLEAHVAALIAQTSSLQTQLTTALGRIEILEARDPEPHEQMTTPQECTYTDFLKCQPMSFQGTKEVVGLTRWLEKMESVFQISNCTVACQDVSYAMLWAALKRMITGKYYPKGEIQKMESEYWNLKVKGLDMLNYNHRFKELALMCERMFPEEAAKVERYIGGLPDMIHGSVKASKLQSMQEAIEFATKMMDNKMLTHAERQAEHTRKFNDT